MSEQLDVSDDLISLILGRLVVKEIMRPLLKQASKWHMRVVMETDFYPVTLAFDRTIEIHYGHCDGPHLTLELSVQTLIDIAEGKTTMIKEVLKRKIRVHSLLRNLRSAWRTYRFFSTALGGYAIGHY